jgi:hypothetical protein
MAPKAFNQKNDFIVPSGDMTLLCLVGGLLVIFYFVITWIVRGADNDRVSRLEKLK